MKPIKPSRRRDPIALGMLLTALVIVIAGCGGDDGENGGAPEENGDAQELSMLLSFRPTIDMTPLLVAQDQGYFEDEGFTVEAQGTDGSSFVTQQIVAGNVQFGWAGSASDVIAFSEAPDLRALGCNQERNIFSIQVPEDSPIQDITELAGSSIGVPEKGSGEAPMVAAALSEYDLTDEVQVIPVGEVGPAVVRALEEGEIAGFAGATTDMASLAAGGVPVRDITPEKYAAMPGDCLISTADVLGDEQNQEAAAAILRGWMEGAYFAQANPEAALEIACQAVPEDCTDKEGFARPLLENALELYKPVEESAPPTSLEEAGWQTTAEVLRIAGTVEENLDIQPLISGPEIEAVQELAYRDLEATKEEAEADAASYEP